MKPFFSTYALVIGLTLALQPAPVAAEHSRRPGRLPVIESAVVTGVVDLTRTSCAMAHQSSSIPLRFRLLQREAHAALAFPSGLLLEGTATARRINVRGTYFRGDGMAETYRVRSGRLKYGFVAFRIRVFGTTFAGTTCRAAYRGKLRVTRAKRLV